VWSASTGYCVFGAGVVGVPAARRGRAAGRGPGTFLRVGLGVGQRRLELVLRLLDQLERLRTVTPEVVLRALEVPRRHIERAHRCVDLWMPLAPLGPCGLVLGERQRAHAENETQHERRDR